MVMNCFYHIKGSDNLINAPHTHENEFEIVQTLSDSGSFIVNSKSYPITSNSVFFINSYDIHCSVLGEKDISQYTRNKLILNAKVLRDIIIALEIDELKDLLSGNTTHVQCMLTKTAATFLDKIFRNIYMNNKDNANTKKLNLYINIFDLFHKCIDSQFITSSKSMPPQQINAILEYINDNLSDDGLSLESISKMFYINKYYLCRLFKKSTNSTLMEYIKLQRITNAKRLLQHSGLSVTEIALSCGFSSSSYFSNIFKTMEGMTPMQYRMIYQRSNH